MLGPRSGPNLIYPTSRALGDGAAREVFSLTTSTAPKSRDRHDPLAALRILDFRFYTSSRFFSGLAQTLLQAAISWQVFQISHSALQLGLIGLMRFLPALIASLYAGAVADIYDRRKIVIISQVVPLLSVSALLFLTLRGHIGLPWIYLLVLFIAVGSAFEGPARQSLLPQVVPIEIFAHAVTVNSTIQQLAFLGGPALAGVLIARFTVPGAYCAYLALLLISAIMLVPVRPRRAARTRGRVTMEAIREGVTYVARNQALLGAMTLDLFAVILGGAEALLPIYATDILHVGAAGYGLLTSSLGIGALVAAILMVGLPPVKRAGRLLLCAVASFGLMTMIFGISRSFPLSLAVYALTGASDQVSVIMRQSIIQLATPDELRGRVSSVSSLFIGASNSVGMVESGLVAALTNATFSVVSGGAICIGVVGTIATAMPGLRRYQIDHGSQLAVRRATTAAAGPAEKEAAGLPGDVTGGGVSAD